MKKHYLLLGICMAVILTGCADLESVLADKMLEASGVYEEDAYITYKDNLDAGNIDEDGYYLQNTETEEEQEKGSVHVTFATNSNLSVKYYKDLEKTSPIDTSACYLNPGDSIYGEVTVRENISSSMYAFSEFAIYEYNEENEKKTYVVEDHFTETGLVLQIPKTYEGTELSVVPLGAYSQREITLEDYYIDDSGVKQALDGTWTINDKEYTGDKAEISPMTSYIVSYQYDTEKYFFMSTEPECYYNNTEEGIIIFNQKESADETEIYSVELHPYISVSVLSKTDRTVVKDGGEQEEVKAGKKYTFSKLKYDALVSIETDKEWKELENYDEIVVLSDAQGENGAYQYMLTVPEKGGEFEFDPSEYTYDHGSIKFTYRGEEVTTKQRLVKGRKLYYAQEEADDGYWLADSGGYIVVGDEEETRQKLNEIEFTEKIEVSVNLNQPSYGGEILYYIDGKQETADKVETYSGTIITMDFEPWEGWMCNGTDGMEYEVTGDNGQSVTVDNMDINNVFVEDEDHKPELTVVLEKSVGENMIFELSASGLKVDESSYESKWYRSDYTLVDAQKIGTEQGIVISMKNKAIPSGKAVKIVVEKTDSNKKKATPEVRYIDDLTKLQEPIAIYAEDEDSTTWYKKLEITIGIVDVSQFKTFDAGENAIVTVKNASTMVELKEGDLIEESQKVVVTISPAAGYYIENGNSAEKTEYKDTMKYSKYLSKMEELIADYPAKKYCEVKLDASDAFAKYTYKYDKKEVSGTVQMKQGDKLTLEYEITDSEHKLQDAGGFLGIGKSDKKVTKELKVTAEYDGKTITRSDFGIEVE